MAGPGHLIIAGAQRCGTTTLRAWLDGFDQVRFASDAGGEPKWFLRGDAVDLGVEAYHDRHWPELGADDLGALRWLGDKSTSYLEVPGVPERIDATLDNVRVIVVLRNPVDRAVSHYYFSHGSGLETRGIEEALDPAAVPSQRDPVPGVSVSPFAYLERGRYSQYLAPWITQFGERIRIVLFEDLVAVSATATGLLGFLDLDGDPAGAKVTPELPHVGRELGGPAAGLDLRTRLDEWFAPSIEELRQLIDLDLDLWLSH